MLIASPAVAQVTVTTQWLYPVETIYAADFTPYGVGQHPDLLGITMVNGAPGDQDVVLRLRIDQVQPSAAMVFEGTTHLFTLSGPLLRITNRDLVSENRSPSFVEYDFTTAAGNLEDQLTATGRLPAGTYRFTTSICTPQPQGGCGIVLDQSELLLELVATTRLELLSPGTPYGDPPTQVMSTSPNFLWSPDAGMGFGTGQYQLRVVPAEGAASAEEAIQNFAMWEHTTSANSAMYPGSAAALPLVPGSTYAWQVVRQVNTSGGFELIESPIYWFRVAEGAGPGDATPGFGTEESIAQLLQLLAEALGLTIDLTGFQVSTPILVGGQAITLEELEELLAAIIAGEVSVGSVRVF